MSFLIKNSSTLFKSTHAARLDPISKGEELAEKVSKVVSGAIHAAPISNLLNVTSVETSPPISNLLNVASVETSPERKRLSRLVIGGVGLKSDETKAFAPISEDSDLRKSPQPTVLFKKSPRVSSFLPDISEELPSTDQSGFDDSFQEMSYMESAFFGRYVEPKEPRSSSMPSLEIVGSKCGSPKKKAGLKKLWDRSLPSCKDDKESRFYDVALKINPELKSKVFSSLMRTLNLVLLEISNPDFLTEYTSQVTMPSAKEKDRFIKFEALLSKLKKKMIKAGISGPEHEGKKFCFWTGAEGQKIANSDGFICDDKVPMVHFLVQCWKTIDKESILHAQMPYLFSLIYANLARGDVSVYVSSTNEKGKAVLNANSAFWLELNVLIKNPNVSSIDTFFIDKQEVESKWEGPFDLKKEGLDKCKDVVELSRRGDTVSVSLPKISECISTWQSKRSTSAPLFLEESSRLSFEDVSTEIVEKKRQSLSFF